MDFGRGYVSSSTLSTSPTTERAERARSVPWRLTWIPCLTRAWSLVASVKPAAIPRGCSSGWQLAHHSSRSAASTVAASAPLRRPPSCIVHRVTVHAGKAIARFFLSRMRIAICSPPPQLLALHGAHRAQRRGHCRGRPTAYCVRRHHQLQLPPPPPSRVALGPRLMASVGRRSMTTRMRTHARTRLTRGALQNAATY